MPLVVLPDALHTVVWTLPEGDADFAMRWQLIKSTPLARQAQLKDIPKPVGQKVRQAFGNADIGSIPFATTTISRGSVNYVHQSRSRHGLVNRVRDWRLLVSCKDRLGNYRLSGPAISRTTAAGEYGESG